MGFLEVEVGSGSVGLGLQVSITCGILFQPGNPSSAQQIAGK